ncbi:MAG: FIST N-terminal domain-containing protein [Saprospiraceae bacterium]
MHAKSIKGKSDQEIKTELQKCTDVDFQPTLAIVFVAITQDIDAISKVLIHQDISIFGATTNGEFIDDEVEKDTTCILLLDLNKDFFKIYLEEYSEQGYRQVSHKIAKQSMTDFDKPIFLIAGSNLETNAEEILFGFEVIVGKDVNIFGCMAGDNFSMTNQFIFSNVGESNRGLVVLTFDGDKVEMKGRATCGWKSMGTEKTVTKSEGNRVYTINDIPALDITAKYGGVTNLRQDNKDILMEIATNCTIQLQRENGEAVMRPGLVVNWDDHSFYCSGTVPQGSKIKFSLPPDFDAIEEVIDQCKDLHSETPDIDAMIYLTCAGRLIAFGPLMSKEIEGIQEVWNVPLVGMFSNAELGRTKGGNLEMHNLSSCVITLRER